MLYKEITVISHYSHRVKLYQTKNTHVIFITCPKKTHNMKCQQPQNTNETFTY